MPRINLVKIVATTVALFLVVGALAGCSKSTSKSTDQPGASAESQADQLVILDRTGFDLPDDRRDFVEQYPDVAVDFTYFEQDADALAKLQSSFQVNLVHPCSSWWGLYVEAGLVQPIDTSRLTHWPDVIVANGRTGRLQWQAVFRAVRLGLRVDPCPHRQNRSDACFLGRVSDPAYTGRLSIPDTAETNQDLVALALGIEDPWNTTDEEDEAIKQKLIDLKPEVLTYRVDSTELAQMIASGDVWVASNVWPDTYGTLLEEGVPVGSCTSPAEGRLGWVCGYGISSQPQDLDLAHAYLDALPGALSRLPTWATNSGTAPPNSKAFDLIDPEVVALFQLDEPDILWHGRIFYRTVRAAEYRAKITTMWDEVKVAP